MTARWRKSESSHPSISRGGTSHMEKSGCHRSAELRHTSSNPYKDQALRELYLLALNIFRIQSEGAKCRHLVRQIAATNYCDPRRST